MAKKFIFPLVEDMGGFAAVQNLCEQQGFKVPNRKVYESWVTRRALPDAIALMLVMRALETGYPPEMISRRVLEIAEA